jgi:general secretion pathway protein K
MTMMTVSPHAPSRGIALLIVLISITVLSILAAAFAYSVKVETKLAQNADAEAQLLWLGRSGVEYARYVLVQQTTLGGEPFDSLNQKWAGGPGSLAESNSVLSGISLDNYQLGDGKFSVKIVDLERRVNINTAGDPTLQRALSLMGVDADDVSVVSDSILDWIDADDDPHVAGAESDYYRSLDPPYVAKSAPIDDLSELLLVRGVTPAMYWGASSTNHAPAAFRQNKLGFGHSPNEARDYPFGLVDVFTPISSGRVNLNTADVNVLQLLPGVEEPIAEAIIKQRAGPDGEDGTEDDTPFRNVNPGQLAGAGVSSQTASQLEKICATRSVTFEVHVNAEIGDYKREFTAILYRSRNDVQVVSFFWK